MNVLLSKYRRGVGMACMNTAIALLVIYSNCMYKPVVTGRSVTEGREQDGRVLFDLHEYDAALTVWKACLETDPNNPRLLNLVATACSMQGEYDTAISLFSRALAGSNGQASIANNMGYAYICKGDYQRAEICFKMALLNDAYHTLAAGNLHTVRHLQDGSISEKAYRLFRHTGIVAHRNQGTNL